MKDIFNIFQERVFLHFACLRMVRSSLQSVSLSSFSVSISLFLYLYLSLFLPHFLYYCIFMYALFSLPVNDELYITFFLSVSFNMFYKTSFLPDFLRLSLLQFHPFFISLEGLLHVCPSFSYSQSTAFVCTSFFSI